MAIKKITPTKGNLIKAKASLAFAKKGYDLLDKKRTVLIREMMSLLDEAKEIQKDIETSFEKAYKALQNATITLGEERLGDISYGISKEKDYDIIFKSVMGVETPKVKFEDITVKPEVGFFKTNPAFDSALFEFTHVKQLIYKLAEVENSVFKLAVEIKKTQKRANALDKIQIPRYTSSIKSTQEILEEKEREEFFRLKKVKSKKASKKPNKIQAQRVE